MIHGVGAVGCDLHFVDGGVARAGYAFDGDAGESEFVGKTWVVDREVIQAAITSATSFSIGAGLPLAVVLLSPAPLLTPLVAATSLVFLAVLGAVGAKAGGANMPKAMIRVTFWGALAMGVTAGVGALFGTQVG